MNAFVLSTLITAVVSLLFGVFVVYKNRKSLVNIIWALVCIGVFVWQIGLFLELIAESESEALFWNKVLYIGAILIPLFFYHFTLEITRQSQKRKISLLIGYSLAIFFLYFNLFTKIFVKGVPPAFEFKYWVKPGILYYPYFVYFLALFFLGFFFLYKELGRSNAIRRQQIKYILLSAAFGVGGSITVFFPQFINVYPFGNYFVIFYIAMVAYAIVKFRLMDIKVVLRKYSVYLASLVSILVPAIALKYIFYQVLPGAELVADFLILVAAMSVFPTLKDYYYKIATKYFFSSLYDEREVIANLSEKLKSTLEVNKIYHYISETLIGSFHALTVKVLVFNEEKKQYEVSHDAGATKTDWTHFTEEKGFYTKIIMRNEVIVVDELKEQAYRKYKYTIDLLKKHEVDILVPLAVKDKIIGLLALGPKESRDMYNDEDLKTLTVIGAQSAIAIENALLFEETRQFSIKLEKEVERATKELRIANKKLRKLDEAKSEFISIASHQLRTPLTVVKGYISMILEGTYGQLTTDKQGPLEKVYESNERLIQLVENLLNISRIESGRLQFSFEELHLENLTASVVDELSHSAKKRGLKLKFKKPDPPLPKVMIDQEKIRQVLINLIDNAIKYTPKGSITVRLFEKERHVYFTVKDSGTGIKPSDISGLFKKFARGTDITLINPGSTGLGLYVAKTMVEAHKGKIWVESKGLNKGSKFFFKIPIGKG